MDALDVLRAFFSEVMVSPAVVSELDGSRIPEAREVLSRHPWIRQQPGPTHLDLGLGVLLDPGEAEAIMLAVELSASILIDEKRGRRVARHGLGLDVHGTIGTLVAARKRGLIGPLEPLISTLIEAGDHLGARLVDEALRAVGEQPK